MYPPPFIGTWKGKGVKKKTKKKDQKKRQRANPGKKQSIQFNSNIRSNILKPKFLKTTPISNFEIMKWIKYFSIKNFKVISRDEIKNIKNNNSYIVNLDDTKGPGTHWIGLYYKKNQILYFDCFGLKPPQELLNLKIEYIYNSTQYQNLYSTTCGYFSLYFINEIHKRSFVDVVQPLKHNNTIYNEHFIEYYFTNI